MDAKIDIGFVAKDASKVPVKDRLKRHKKLYDMKSKPVAEGEVGEFDMIVKLCKRKKKKAYYHYIKVKTC